MRDPACLDADPPGSETALDYPARLSCPRRASHSPGTLGRWRSRPAQSFPGLPIALPQQRGLASGGPSHPALAPPSAAAIGAPCLSTGLPACLLSSRGKEDPGRGRRNSEVQLDPSLALREGGALLPSLPGLESFGASRCKYDFPEAGASDLPASHLRGFSSSGGGPTRPLGRLQRGFRPRPAWWRTRNRLLGSSPFVR